MSHRVHRRYAADSSVLPLRFLYAMIWNRGATYSGNRRYASADFSGRFGRCSDFVPMSYSTSSNGLIVGVENSKVVDRDSRTGQGVL